MNRNQAILALRDGHKLTHEYFTQEEYIYFKDGEIYSEDDVCHGWSEFWSLRTADCWDKGWTIIN